MNQLMGKFKIFCSILSFLFISVAFQNCGNIAVNKSSDSASGNSPAGNNGESQENLNAPVSCRREAALASSLADITIPADKYLYNNYFTRTHVLGDDLFILADYSYGNQIITGQPATGATGVVEAKYFSSSGAVSSISLPTIAGYTWNSQAGSAPSWCFIGDSISNFKTDVYVLFYCTGNSTAAKFTNHIYKFSKNSKTFEPFYVSTTFVHGINLNKANELMFIETVPSVPGVAYTYQIKKMVNPGAPTNIGTQFTSAQIQEHFLLRPGIYETENGELNVLTFKNNIYGRLKVAGGSFSVLNWSQQASFVLQAFDTKKIFYSNNTAGGAPATKIFEVDPINFSESLKYSDGLYTYNFTALVKNVFTKAGFDRSVMQYKTWISYDNGVNFSAVSNLSTQVNQTVITADNKFYSIAVDQFSGGKIKASIYSLNCAD